MDFGYILRVRPTRYADVTEVGYDSKSGLRTKPEVWT